MTTESMPPLPRPHATEKMPTIDRSGVELTLLFTADQMHAYAQAYAAQEVAKEREECARVCDGLVPEFRRWWKSDAAATAGMDCANAIRSRP